MSLQVWIVEARREPKQDRYNVAVYGSPKPAEAKAGRWLRQYPRGEVHVVRYTVLDGEPSRTQTPGD